jgi:ankyrin repeat protein
MIISNIFVFQLNNRLQHLDLKTRQDRMKKILGDLSGTGILDPLPLDDEDTPVDLPSILAHNLGQREDRLHLQMTEKANHQNWQIEEDPEETAEELEWRSRGGRNDAHDAIIQGDVEALEAICRKQPNLLEERDSEGHTPIYYALVEQSPKVLKLLRKLKLIKTLP